MTRMACTLALALFLLPAAAAEIPAKLKNAAPNTPVVLVTEDSGGRLSPGSFYAPSGMHSYSSPACNGISISLHYDVEYFNLATAAWTNRRAARFLRILLRQQARRGLVFQTQGLFSLRPPERGVQEDQR